MDIEEIRQRDEYDRRYLPFVQATEDRTDLLAEVERLQTLLVKSTFMDAAIREELDQQKALAQQLAEVIRGHRHVGVCDAICPYAIALAAYDTNQKEQL